MPERWRKPRPRHKKTSAGSALLAEVGDLMGRANSRFEGAGEGEGFGFTAECHGVLIQANLPLRLCHFFYQDLHC